MTARYAIFICPDPASQAGQAAAEWLGRCAVAGQRSQRQIPGVAPSLLRTVTQAPRRYGFHATLKAPFRLARGMTRARLERAVGELAGQLEACVAPRLTVEVMDGFLALVPQSRDARVGALAARCVMELDGFRAAMDDADRERRDPARLTGRERMLLERWGYPFVMEAFRFHYSLTGTLTPFEEGVVERVREHAGVHFAPHLAALRRIDSLALFEERHPAHDLRLVERVRLRPPAATTAPGELRCDERGRARSRN